MYSISRRDDVESLGYVLVGLAKGSLPWDYLEDLDTSKMSSTELRSKYLDEKKQQVPAKLCEGMEQEFELYFNHTLGLSFEAEPDYRC